MRKALSEAATKDFEDQGFCIATQPIVHGDVTEIPTVAGYELLARKREICGAVTYPADFIPEMDIRQLATLDAFSFTEAIEQSKLITGGAYSSFNTSFRSLSQYDFRDYLRKRLLTLSADERSRLMLEITDAHIANTKPGRGQWNTMRHDLREIANMGVKIAIDEFDYRNTPLFVISEIPVSAVKISINSLRQPGSMLDAMDYEVLRSVGRSMSYWGCDVIAIGIETDEQLRLSREMGANYFQGFMFGRPLVAADLPDLPGSSKSGNSELAVGFK